MKHINFVSTNRLLLCLLSKLVKPLSSALSDLITVVLTVSSDTITFQEDSKQAQEFLERNKAVVVCVRQEEDVANKDG